MATAEEELECMQEIELHLEGYYDKEDLEPGFETQIETEIMAILGKYYALPSQQFSVQAARLGDKKVSVAISPLKLQQCPKCLDKKLSKYSLDTQPVTWMYYCECGWEGEN